MYASNNGTTVTIVFRYLLLLGAIKGNEFTSGRIPEENLYTFQMNLEEECVMGINGVAKVIVSIFSKREQKNMYYFKDSITTI